MSGYAYSPNRLLSSQIKEHSSSTSTQSEMISNQQQIEDIDQYGIQEFTSDTVDWTSLMLFNCAQLSNNSVDKILPTNDFNGKLRMISAMMDGVQSYQHSPAQSTGGKSLDALMDVSGSMMVNANPLVSAVDMFLPNDWKLSNLIDGSTSAVSTLTEGLITQDSDGMEQFIHNSKNSEYSWLIKEAVEAGEFWTP